MAVPVNTVHGLTGHHATGVPHDLNRARQLFVDAANRGFAEAAYTFATWDSYSNPGSQHTLERAKWMKIAPRIYPWAQRRSHGAL
ncbi:MAG: hypothetical protein HQL50_08220 [Magnetococcales bacterium]|nr:hypothetical protein [Magnetococcales bacterium]